MASCRLARYCWCRAVGRPLTPSGRPTRPAVRCSLSRRVSRQWWPPQEKATWLPARRARRLASRVQYQHGLAHAGLDDGASGRQLFAAKQLVIAHHLQRLFGAERGGDGVEPAEAVLARFQQTATGIPGAQVATYFILELVPGGREFQPGAQANGTCCSGWRAPA